MLLDVVIDMEDVILKSMIYRIKMTRMKDILGEIVDIVTSYLKEVIMLKKRELFSGLLSSSPVLLV